METVSGAKRRVAQKCLCLLLSLCFLVLSFPLAARALDDTTQHKTNAFVGGRDVFSVFLLKYVREDDGSTTELPIPRTEFYLYRQVPGGEPVRVGGSYLADENGQIGAAGLSDGEYFFREVRPAYGYTWDIDGGQNVAEYPFQIGSDTDPDVPQVLRVYNTRLRAPLTIRKLVQGVGGAEPSEAQKLVPFVFTVEFSDGGSYDYHIGGDSYTLQSGGALSLKHGEEALFNNLPVGLHYTVRETPVDGFAALGQNHQGNVLREGSTVTFTNTSMAQTGSLSVTKQVAGEGADPEKLFDFAVTFSDGGTYAYSVDGGPQQDLASGGVLQLKSGQTASFSGLPAGLGYTVAEADYISEGYTPANQSYAGTITTGAVSLPFLNVLGGEEEPGALRVAKQLTGDAAEVDKDFAFTVTFSDGGSYPYTIDGGVEQILASGDTLTLRGGQQAVFSGLPMGLGYTVTEADYTADGYTAGVGEATGQIGPGATAEVVFVNDRPGTLQEETTLTVHKRVEGPVPAALADWAFNFTLVADGAETPFTLKSGEEQTFTLPYGAVYEVREANSFADGFVLSSFENGAGTATGDTVTVVATNTYTGPGMLTISGEKTWDLTAEPDAALPESITVRLKQGDTVVRTNVVTPDADGRWLYSFEVPQFEADGVTEIGYTVEEEVIGGFVALADGMNLTNTRLAAAEYAPQVQKTIEGDTPVEDETFQFRIYPQGNAPAPSVPTIAITGEGNGAFPAIRFTATGTYAYTITEQAGTAGGYTYDTKAWTLTVEIALQGTALQVVSAEYTQLNDNAVYDAAAFTNRFDLARTTQVTVTKRWVLPEGMQQPDEAHVQLYRNGQAFGQPVVLHSGNGWTHTFTRLDAAEAWTVDEVDIPAGFVHTVSGSAAEGFVITNAMREARDTLEISGTKTWVHGTNPAPQRPASITVLVKDGDYVAAQKTVTAADGWRWSFTLPRYRADGREIAYTVDEVAVPGYTKRVNGYDLINTYSSANDSSSDAGGGAGSETGGSPTTSGQTTGMQTGVVPQTDDPSLWPLWFLIMVAGPFVLRFVLFHKQRRPRGKKRVRNQMR